MLARLVLFLIFAAGFSAGVVAVPRVSRDFARLLPDNYRQIAAEAMARGDFTRAQLVAERRLARAYYDMEAHYVQAEAMARQGRHAEAAEVMKLVLRKIPAARARNLPASGFDESKTLERLARYLWAAGRFTEAGEIARAAIDSGTAVLAREASTAVDRVPQTPEEAEAVARLAIKLNRRQAFDRALSVVASSRRPQAAATCALLEASFLERNDRSLTAAEHLLRETVARLPADPAPRLALAAFLERRGATTEPAALRADARLTTGVRYLPPSMFSPAPGVTISSETLLISRNAVLTARVSTGVFRVTDLLFTARASSALGVYPLMAVKAGETEIVRLYLDGLQPLVGAWHLWPDGAPKMLDLKLEFLNDAYDPFTRSDRNITLSDIILY